MDKVYTWTIERNGEFIQRVMVSYPSIDIEYYPRYIINLVLALKKY